MGLKEVLKYSTENDILIHKRLSPIFIVPISAHFYFFAFTGSWADFIFGVLSSFACDNITR